MNRRSFCRRRNRLRRWFQPFGAETALKVDDCRLRGYRLRRGAAATRIAAIQPRLLRRRPQSHLSLDCASGRQLRRETEYKSEPSCPSGPEQAPLSSIHIDEDRSTARHGKRLHRIAFPTRRILGQVARRSPAPAPSEYVALPITTEGSILVVKDETFFGGVEVSIAGVELQFQFAFQIEEVQPLKGGGPVGTIVSR